MAGRPSNKTPSEIGDRIARLRKAAGLSQVQLAARLRMPQRTLSYYEREAEHVPSSMLLPIAEALGASVEDLLGMRAAGGAKRGPASKLERLTEQLARLPRARQRFVVELLENAVAKAQ